MARLSTAERVEALDHPERRRLLAALLDAQPDDELRVTAGVDDADRHDVLVTMHHQHLPKLCSMGILVRGVERHHVRRGPAFDDLRPLLERVDTGRDELVGRSP